MNFTIPPGLDRKETMEFLKANKHLLLREKKAKIKKCDQVVTAPMFIDTAGKLHVSTNKANREIPDSPTLMELNVRSVINTTNLLDSHSDVHIPGLWKKSLKENKNLYLCEDHELTFRGIISGPTDIKGYTQQMAWKELGYNATGVTEALIFDSVVKRDRNEFMFEQYRKGYVTNHSVGMQYVQLYFCVNEPEDRYWAEEFENWEKYFPQIINADTAEEQGYFWAVTEAKVVEGSAVPVGSNWVTPTLENNNINAKSQSTEDRAPSEDTHEKQPQPFDIDAAIKTVKIII